MRTFKRSQGPVPGVYLVETRERGGFCEIGVYIGEGRISGVIHRPMPGADWFYHPMHGLRQRFKTRHEALTAALEEK